MTSIGFIGTGAIGTNAIRLLADGAVAGARVTAVYNRTPDRAHRVVEEVETDHDIAVVDGPVALCDHVDLVVECASQSVIENSAADILETGTDMVIMSIGAFRDPELLRRVRRTAEANDARLYAPSGAIGGLDAITAIGRGGFDTVSLDCYRPPKYLGAYLDEDQHVPELEDGQVIFDGTASEAAAAFPSHMNVAIALTLAAKVDPGDVDVHIEVDVDAPRSRYVITAHGRAGTVDAQIQNFRTPEDPDTSLLNVFSVIEKLDRISNPVTFGT